jgi:transmembrane sensor
MPIDQQILDAAVEWQTQLEGEAPDYEGFTTWLEADTRHNEAYSRIIALDILIDHNSATLATILPANDDEPTVPIWRKSLLGLAATLVLFVGVGTLYLPGKDQGQIDIATERGQSRVVQMADASAVTLDGATRISYAADAPRAITLISGNAHFAVKHDAAKPFSIAAGRYQIRDLGTEFTVSCNADHLTVSVSSGLVDIAGPDMPLTPLRAGDRLDIFGNKVERTHIDPNSVGSWRNGRLVYSNVPLQLVVADINHYAETPVVIDAALSARRFSGVLTIGDGRQLAPTLAWLMGASLKKEGSTSHIRVSANP